jgi:hypothetical protein
MLKHVLDRVSEVENYVVDLVSGEGRAWVKRWSSAV